MRSVSDIDERSNAIEWEYASGFRRWVSYGNEFKMRRALSDNWRKRMEKRLRKRREAFEEKKALNRESDPVTLFELAS